MSITAKTFVASFVVGLLTAGTAALAAPKSDGVEKEGHLTISEVILDYDNSECPSGDFMSRMNRLSGAPS